MSTDSLGLMAATWLPALASLGIGWLVVRAMKNLWPLLGDAQHGALRGLGASLAALDGSRCVRIERRRRGTRRTETRSQGRTTVTVATEWLDEPELLTVDATLEREGQSPLPVDLRRARVVEARTLSKPLTRDELLAARPELAGLSFGDDLTIERIEEVVLEDASVQVYGDVSSGEGQGYRSPTEGFAGPLVVLVGDRGTVLVRSLISVAGVLAVVCGLLWITWLSVRETQLLLALGW